MNLFKMKNQVIKIKDPAHGAKVIGYWRSRGVNTEYFSGNSVGWYYGVINGEFGLHTSCDVNKFSAEIIELPEENPYPKVMRVWHINRPKAVLRVVFMEKCGKYLAWDSAETLEEAEKTANVTAWQHAEDIEEHTIKELTLEEVAKLAGVSVEQLRIKK